MKYTFQLCLKDRDLIGGLQFESDSIVRLIIERCMRVIVILSPEFLASNANKFFVLFAHALSIGKSYRTSLQLMSLLYDIASQEMFKFVSSEWK